MTCLREAGSFAPAFAKPASAGEGRSAKAGRQGRAEVEMDDPAGA